MALPDARQRAVRVFISSTFKDMERERAILVGQTFPELRAKWRARGVDITEVDLRWGVSEEQAARGETLAVCLDQIDRCRPFFLAMLGERYGWQLTDGSVSPSVAETFPVLRGAAGKSLTEIEILHGFLANSNTEMRALVLARRSSFLAELSPEVRKDYEPESPEAASKMAALKQQLMRSGAQIIEYDRPENVDGIVASVLDGQLTALFPETAAASDLDIESGLHQAFANDRLAVHVGAEAVLEALDQWAADPTEPLALVTGESGAGKSAAAANWAARAMRSMPPSNIFQHYLGAVQHSGKTSILARRLQHRLSSATALDANTKQERTADQVYAALQEAGAAARADGGHFVLVLDALDQAEVADDWHGVISKLPAGVKVLGTLKSDEKRDWNRHRWREFELPPLDRGAQERLITAKLASMGKELSQRQKALLLDHHCSSLPLFLSSLVDELRWGATFNDLDARITDYLGAHDVSQFFAKKLARLESQCGRSETEALLRLIAASRSGIEERELLRVASKPPLVWARVNLAMGDGLLRYGSRIAFSHSYMRDAVRDRYLQDPQANRAVHLTLAEHYESQLPITARGPSGHGMIMLDMQKTKPDADGTIRVTWPNQPVARDIPWHFQQAEDWARLEALLSKLDRFQFLLSQGNENLASYWRVLAAHGREPASTLHAAVDAQLSTHEKWSQRSLETAVDVANFLYSIAPTSSHTLQLWQDVLSATRRCLGPEHGRVRAVGAMIGAILRERGQIDEAQEVLSSAHSGVDASGDLGVLERDQLQALHEQANLMFARGDHADAVELERRVYHAVARQRGADDEDAIHIAVAFCKMLAAARQFSEADALIAETMTRCVRSGGATSDEALACRQAMERSLFEQRRFAEAATVGEELLSDTIEMKGASAPAALQTMHNLGFLRHKLGDLARARELLTACYETRKKVLGVDARGTLATLDELAAVCETQCDFNAAEPLLRDLIEGYERTRPANDRGIFEARWRLSFLLRDRGNSTRALEWATATFEKHLSVRLRDDPEVIRSCVRMAQILLECGDSKKARDVLEPALDLAENTLGGTDDVTTSALFMYGRVLIAEKEFATAKARFEAALVDFQAVLAPDDPRFQRAQRTLAKAELGLEDFESAKRLLTEAHQMLAARFGERDRQTLDCLVELADAHDAAGEIQTAVALCRDIVRQSIAATGAGSESTAHALNRLGRCYLDLRDDSNAYECFKQTVSWLERHFGYDDDRTIGVLVNLAAAANNSGRKDEARLMFQRILAWHERQGAPTHADAQLARRYLRRGTRGAIAAALAVVGRFIFGSRR